MLSIPGLNIFVLPFVCMPVCSSVWHEVYSFSHRSRFRLQFYILLYILCGVFPYLLKVNSTRLETSPSKLSLSGEWFINLHLSVKVIMQSGMMHKCASSFHFHLSYSIVPYLHIIQWQVFYTKKYGYCITILCSMYILYCQFFN